mmetsp:Transcript_60644/g.123032  ORF Transcript_60644/g.123032 Transcript_60644/m.123032 type:complete len:127 (-) Transcript_60644:25-405(-)
MAESEGGKKQSREEKHTQHSILLVQPSKHDSTRSYQNFRAPTEAWEYLLRSFETRLRELNPAASSIGYGETALQQYLDDLKELVILVHDPELHAYRSYDRKYIKQQVLDYLSAMLPAAENQTESSK